KAANANRPSSPLWLIPQVALGLGGLAGLIWVLNLPYPMIRRPVANTAPILLLPSYLSMDHNYRQAIAKVEQADQLVNNATSSADLELGKEKVTQAQKHLDALPVWFLGYEPQMYGSLFNFGWKFTLDEFETARANIGRMEAKVFQETNAFTQWEKAQQDIQQAKQTYQQAQDTTTKQQAIATWQAGIDQLNQIPPNTLAKQQAEAATEAYLRDFEQVSGLVAGNDRTNNSVAVAQQFHAQAKTSCPDAAHSANRWQECANLLSKATAMLEKVPPEDPGYVESQKLLAAYEAELGNIRIRKQDEEESVQAYQSAQNLITNLPKTVNESNRDSTANDLLSIINKLEQVKPQTTVYEDARNMITSAENKKKEL
ncbi:MAG: hypothetical protein WBG70_11840, partial [Spirulinaceae cyanobacterium]